MKKAIIIGSNSSIAEIIAKKLIEENLDNKVVLVNNLEVKNKMRELEYLTYNPPPPILDNIVIYEKQKSKFHK